MHTPKKLTSLVHTHLFMRARSLARAHTCTYTRACAGAARLRNVQQPDQAYGLIFNLDHVIANTRAALAQAWWVCMYVSTGLLGTCTSAQAWWVRMLRLLAEWHPAFFTAWAKAPVRVRARMRV